MTDLEYIDLYFQGVPLPEEKERFEKRVLEDKAFAEEVAFYLSVEKLVGEKAGEEKKKAFRELYRHYPPQDVAVAEAVETTEATETPKAPRTAVVRPMKRRWFPAAAASVLVAVAASYLFLRSPGPGRLAEQYIEKNLTSLSVTMGGAGDTLQAGIRLYNEGRLEAAALKFEQVLQADPSHYRATRYAGMAYLRLDNYDKALLHFGRLERFTELDANPAKLYQAITLMKRNGPGDKEQARKLLNQVVENDLEGKPTAELWLRKL